MTNLKILNLVLNIHRPKKPRTANRRLAKKRVQCLNEDFCFKTNLVLNARLVLLKPLLRQAPNRTLCAILPNHIEMNVLN